MNREQLSSVSNVYRLLKWNLKKRLGAKSILVKTEFGARLSLDFLDQSAPHIFFQKYETEESDIIRSHVRRDMTVLDIGANIGYFTLHMGQLISPHGKAYAFEPNPRMVLELKKNITLNEELNDGRIRVENMALGANETETDFFSPIKGYEGVGGLKDTKRAPLGQVYRVRVTTLDRWTEVKDVRQIDFIKMDVEGGEFDVLRGANRILEVMRPSILFEAYEPNTVPYGYAVKDILDFLKQRRYEIQPLRSGYNFFAIPKP